MTEGEDSCEGGKASNQGRENARSLCYGRERNLYRLLQRIMEPVQREDGKDT